MLNKLCINKIWCAKKKFAHHIMKGKTKREREREKTNAKIKTIICRTRFGHTCSKKCFALAAYYLKMFAMVGIEFPAVCENANRILSNASLLIYICDYSHFMWLLLGAVESNLFKSLVVFLFSFAKTVFFYLITLNWLANVHAAHTLYSWQIPYST